MSISIWLSLALTVSVVLNVVFFWLVREQSKMLSIFSDNSSDLIELISAFSKHVKAVYSLEAFYGDETLQGLMDHARSLTAILEDQYGDVASLSEEMELEEQEEQKNDDKEASQEGQHVFYAGTRRSDN